MKRGEEPDWRGRPHRSSFWPAHRLHPNDTNKRSVIAGDRGRPTHPPIVGGLGVSRQRRLRPTDRPTDRGGRGCAAVASAAVIGAACNVLIERPGQRPACHSPLSPIPPHLTAATVCYAEPTFPRRGRPRNLCLTVNDCVRYDAATSASPLQQTPPMPTLVFCARLDPTGV